MPRATGSPRRRWAGRRPRAAALLSLLVMALSLPAWAGPPEQTPAEQAPEKPYPLVSRNTLVDLRPELDRGALLVIQSAVLVNESGEPYDGDIRVRIPAGVELGKACELDEKGTHLCKLPAVTQSDEWLELSWPAERTLQPGQTYHAYVEYYAPMTLPKGAGLREATFKALPVEAARQAEIRVTLPKGASAYQAERPESLKTTSAEGIATYRYLLGALEASQPIGLTFAYELGRGPVTASTASASSPGAAGGGAGAGRATGAGLELASQVLVALFAAVLAGVMLAALRRPKRRGR